MRATFYRGQAAFAMLLLSACTLSPSEGWGQQTESGNTPAARQSHPDTPPPVPSPAPRVPPHAFWDRRNVLLFSGIAVTRGLDYASTRNMQARGREEILLSDDVVNNSAGFAGLEAAGTLTSVGISYLFHRTGHHKLERWFSIGHIGVTSFGVARNYSLKSKHPAQGSP